ncbi:hypothetical protein AOLI_G00194450 [Acnodon oligacanthus]
MSVERLRENRACAQRRVKRRAPAQVWRSYSSGSQFQRRMGGICQNTGSLANESGLICINGLKSNMFIFMQRSQQL